MFVIDIYWSIFYPCTIHSEFLSQAWNWKLGGRNDGLNTCLWNMQECGAELGLGLKPTSQKG